MSWESNRKVGRWFAIFFIVTLVMMMATSKVVVVMAMGTMIQAMADECRGVGVPKPKEARWDDISTLAYTALLFLLQQHLQIRAPFTLLEP